MKGTLIDTTSLIMLAMGKVNRNYNIDFLVRDKYFQLPGIEAVLLSENIIIDYPSYKRNLKLFPELKKLEKLAEFINVNNDDESNCYSICTKTIVPLMSKPDEFLINIFNRQIDFFDYCEMSNSYEGKSSVMWKWEYVSRLLSGGQYDLANALEKAFGKYTPSSGAALTNLIRFLYYTICQEIYDCNLSLHYLKSYFLLNLNGETNFKKKKFIAKNIIDVFDDRYSDNYNRNFKEWIGSENTEIKIPLLINYVNKNRNTEKTLIEDLIELRNHDEFIEYREAINELQSAITKKDKFTVNEILSKIETYTNNIIKGIKDNPSKIKIETSISISIPFVGGLGIGIPAPISIFKSKKTSGDKILIFLHKLIDSHS